MRQINGLKKMTNIYNIVATKAEDEFDYEHWLRNIGAYEVFKPIFEMFDDKITCIKIVRFIVFSYTPESEFLIEKGSKWESISKRVAEYLDIPSDLYSEVYQLESEAVQTAVTGWLKYQNDDGWTNYCTFRDLRQQMVVHALKPISESVDLKSKMDAAKYAKELLEMMDSVKNKFVEKAPELKIPVQQHEKQVKARENLSKNMN